MVKEHQPSLVSFCNSSRYFRPEPVFSNRIRSLDDKTPLLSSLPAAATVAAPSGQMNIPSKEDTTFIELIISSSLTVKGSLTAMGGDATTAGGAGCCDRVDHIRVKITGATDVNDVPFDPNEVLVTYQDDANVALMTHVPGVGPDGTANTCRGDDPDNNWYIMMRNNGTVTNILEPGEVAELYLCTANLTPALTANSQFRIELIPQEGAPVVLQRRTPLALAPVMNLD